MLFSSRSSVAPTLVSTLSVKLKFSIDVVPREPIVTLPVELIAVVPPAVISIAPTDASNVPNTELILRTDNAPVQSKLTSLPSIFNSPVAVKLISSDAVKNISSPVDKVISPEERNLISAPILDELISIGPVLPIKAHSSIPLSAAPPRVIPRSIMTVLLDPSHTTKGTKPPTRRAKRDTLLFSEPAAIASAYVAICP